MRLCTALLLIIISQSIFCQPSSTNFKFTIDKYRIIYNDKNGEYNWCTDIRDTSFSISIDGKQDKVSFPDKHYDMKIADMYNDDEKGWTWIKWIGNDINKIKCGIRVCLNNDKTSNRYGYAMIYVDYLNHVLAYTGKLLN